MIFKWILIVAIINGIWFSSIKDQWNLFERMNDKVFKRVKIKGKMRIFFRAIGGQSVSKHGIVKALLVVQIKGYILSILSAISVIILWFVIQNINFCILFVMAALFFNLTVDIIVFVVLSRISKRRCRDKY